MMTNMRLFAWPRLHIVATLLILGGVLASPAGAAPPTVTLLAQGGTNVNRPLDAAPSPDGAIVFFVARMSAGLPGIFRVSSHGGAVTTILAGAPLIDPRAIVVSADGQTLYVADPSASHGGAVFAVSLTGATVRVVAGTQGKQPQAADPGLPLAIADGVAARANGEILVAGRTDLTSKTGVVLLVRNGLYLTLVNRVILGNPAGIALTRDQSMVLVSSLSSAGTSQVLIVDVATGATRIFNDVIGANHSSGGLHRALNTNFFGWADYKKGGGVYGVNL